jgi:hypothetical protein
VAHLVTSSSRSRFEGNNEAFLARRMAAPTFARHNYSVQRQRAVLAAVVLATGAAGLAATEQGDDAYGRNLESASAACLAAPVRNDGNPAIRGLGRASWIAPRPGPIFGVLFGGRALNGRFSVYTGGVDPKTRLSEKVLWIVPLRARSRAGSSLHIVGRLGHKRFTQRFNQAWSEQTPGLLFASILRAPSPGCWELNLRTGQIQARTRVLVVS